MNKSEYQKRAGVAAVQYMEDIRRISLVTEDEQSELERKFGIRVCTDRHVYLLTSLATSGLVHFEYSKELQEALKNEWEVENPPSQHEVEFLRLALDSKCQGNDVLYEEYLENAWNCYQIRRRGVH